MSEERDEVMQDVFVHSLSDRELERLENLLLKYGKPGAIQTLSELDGFIVALASSAGYEDDDQWLAEIGGKAHKPRKEAEEEAFHALLFRYRSMVVYGLYEDSDSFEPLFIEGPDSLLVDEWCEGYMRGLRLAGQPSLPAQYLEAIALHGLPANHGAARALSGDAYEDSVDAIIEGVRALYQHGQVQER